MHESVTRVIIAGGRDFSNYGLLKTFCDITLKSIGAKNPEIICGKAKGADTLGEKYAKKKGISITEFPPTGNFMGSQPAW